MSERPHYTSPSAASSTAEEHPNITGERRYNVGASSTQDFRQQQHTHARPPQPHELTAEWTVRAQLTFARAGEKVRREFSSNDPLNPVRVIYKWSTLDATATSVDNDDDNDLADDDVETSSTLRRQTSSRCSSNQSAPQKRVNPAIPKRHHSFRSTASSSLNAPTTTTNIGDNVEPTVDSAFSSGPTPTSSSSFKQHTSSNSVPSGSGMATAALYGTRCRSTCNIVVSAVADFLPPDATAAAATGNESFAPTTRATTASDFIPEMEPDPFVYNTTASYTVLPQKSFDDNSTTATTSKNFTAFGRVLALRDAFSQTSDTETRYFEQHEPYNVRRLHQHHQQQHDYQHRPYEQRRSTAEGLVRPTASSTMRSSNADIEGKAAMPTPSTLKSASMSRIPSLLQHQQQATSKHGSADQQKKPRTVHIDVYCTGSEDDENADAEASSSSDDDDSKRHEVDSNSTPQTVLDNEQMRLRHQRISGQALPRRLAATQQHQQKQKQQELQQNLSSQSDLNIGHGLTKSSTAEEISESKQLLFRKHIGDQRAAKLATLRQKYQRQTSDDTLSSIYPNSSHSTVRDATCSSISSTVPSLQGPHDVVDSSWKETEEAEDYHSIAKSDSFDYANSVDRLRIRQMEKYWSRDEDPMHHQHVSQPPYQPHSHSPTKPHYLHTISEVNSQPSSPYRPAAPTSFFQRNDTITSDLETFSESDGLYNYPSRTSNTVGFQPYQRQMSQPIPRIPRTPSPQKTMKPTSPLVQQTSHFPRNRPGFLQFFGPHSGLADSPQTTPTSPTTQPGIESAQTQAQSLLYPSYQPHLQRWKSETRENLSSSITPATSEHSPRTSPQIVSSPYTPSPQRCGSEVPQTTTSTSIHQPSPAVARRFDMHRDSPSVSDASTVVSGYTQEYLEKARKFGKVVSTVRKPGHHVGPTKNPNCSCESCQRWLAERFQLRGRAFSLGERPILKRPARD